MSDTAKIEIYGTNTCGYCTAARMLLKKKGLNYTDISISADPDAYRIMQQRSGKTSVPQIFIDDQPIGGFDELYTLDRCGDLDRLLGVPESATDN